MPRSAPLPSTVGEGGKESASTCALRTVLCGHHPSFYKNLEFGVATTLNTERDMHWADHFFLHPRTWFCAMWPSKPKASSR